MRVFFGRNRTGLMNDIRLMRLELGLYSGVGCMNVTSYLGEPAMECVAMTPGCCPPFAGGMTAYCMRGANCTKVQCKQQRFAWATRGHMH